MSIFDRDPRETLEAFFRRVNSYFSANIAATTTKPATVASGPTDANGSPVEDPAEDTSTRSGKLHPEHKTGI